MKGLSKFMMKQIYLIIAIVSIVLVINQITTLNRNSARGVQTIDLRSQANDILNTLLSSTDCLAMQYNGQLLVSEFKLDQYQQLYSNMEPNCIKSYEYGYSIKVEKFNNTLKRGKYWEPEIPTGNRDIVLILDNSKSMEERSSISDPVSKMHYAKSAVKEFVKCANETDRISIIIFGPGLCGSRNLMTANGFPEPFVQLDSESTKDRISGIVEAGIVAESGTPLISSLETAIDTVRTADRSKDRLVVIFTDGRETCCESCRSGYSSNECEKDINCGAFTFDKIQGTCCCLEACKDALCSHSSPNLDYLISEKIPIFSIFLGSDQLGVEQIECITEKTGGESFKVEDPDILKSLFCEIIGSAEVEEEDYQEWVFGSQDHSKGELLDTTFSATSPIMIKTNDLTVQPGLITLTLYNGDLEELTGIIRGVCESGNMLEKRIELTSKVEFENGNVCMYDKSKKICKKVHCNYQINFDGIDSPGSYLIKVVKNRNVIEVIV